MEDRQVIQIKETSMICNDVEVKVGYLFTYCDRIYEVTGFEQIKIGDNTYDKVLAKSVSGEVESINLYDLTDRRDRKFITGGASLEELSEIATGILAGNVNPDILKIKEEVQESGLIVQDVNLVKSIQAKHAEMSARVDAIKKVMNEKAEVARRAVSELIHQANVMVSRLNNIIFTLELYAGIKESVIQIKIGTPAPEDTPIYLNQSMRFMDEEVGDPENGGITYETADQFDEWLLKWNKKLNCFHYELLISQKKGVRIMRMRRDASERARNSYDLYGNRWRWNEEMKTCIIIRNGENIYVVRSQMEFQTKLFPDLEEFTDILSQHKDSVYDKLEKYKHGIILMQGLVDRTDVFGMVAGKISFLTLDSQEAGDVVFQYEMEDNLLTDGSKTFLDFLNTAEVKAGDRVLVRDAFFSGWRYAKYYSKYNEPDPPENGVYKMEWDSAKQQFYISYMQKGQVYGKWGNEVTDRKQKTRYALTLDDKFIMPFDKVSHRDIDWINNMEYDRRDRRKYLRVHGMLRFVKKLKMEEMELERPFALMLCQLLKITELEAMDAIHWWKTKNKHKRAISLDDQKALRMIVKKVEKDGMEF